MTTMCGYSCPLHSHVLFCASMPTCVHVLYYKTANLLAMLSQAELKVLSASDQAARSASPVSPSRPAASPSFASRSNQGNGVRKASSTSAQPKSRGAQAAASHTGPFRGQHEDARAPDPDSDVDCCPDLLSNETDASPEASPTHADGAPSSASGQSTSTSHAPTHGPFYERPPDSDESDTSPRVRHWPNQTSPPSAIGRAAHAAMRGNPLYGVSPASQESHADAESSVAESADEQEDSGSQDSYRYLQQPQTKQSLDLAAAYFQQAFVLFYRRDWEQAVRHLLSGSFLNISAHNSYKSQACSVALVPPDMLIHEQHESHAKSHRSSMLTALSAIPVLTSACALCRLSSCLRHNRSTPPPASFCCLGSGACQQAWLPTSAIMLVRS